MLRSSEPTDGPTRDPRLWCQQLMHRLHDLDEHRSRRRRARRRAAWRWGLAAWFRSIVPRLWTGAGR